MKAVRVIIILSIPCFIFAAIFLPAQMKSGDVVAKTAMLMGTIVEIKLPISGSLTRAAAQQKIDLALAEVRRVENIFSAYDEDSEVSKINRLHKGDRLKLSEEAFGLIDKAVGLCAATGGAFDITVKPLIDLWAEAKSTGNIPSDEAVRAAAAKTGCQDIILDRSSGTISLGKDGMSVDLGGIAKGYASGMAAAVLRKNGVDNAIINCGGDMYCLGRRSEKEPWRVGIRHPREREEILMELRLENKAIDTSGDYEKYFVAGGKRYSHIIDPRTGYPVVGDVASASVIADNPIIADALATAMCVLGRDGLSVLASMSGIDAIMVLAQNGKMSINMSDETRDKYHVSEIR